MFLLPVILRSFLTKFMEKCVVMDKQDMSSMGLINSEFTAITAPGPMAITPELFGGLPRALTSIGQHQHFHDDQHQTILDHYAINPSFVTTASVNVGTGTDTYEEEDDDEADSHNMCDEQFANQFVNQFTNNEDENSLDDNEEIDEDEYHEGTDSNNSNSVGFEATGGTQISGQNLKNVPFKRRTKGTQTNRKIKPVKRPGLVLKTPIAYQPCLDPSVIPIQRDGMGTFCFVLISFVDFIFSSFLFISLFLSFLFLPFPFVLCYLYFVCCMFFVRFVNSV